MIMQNLYLNAGLPPPDFASMASHHTDNSISLNNMDLSRISADGSESVRNVDFSFSTNNNNNNNNSLNHSIYSTNDHLFAIDELPTVTDSPSKKNKNKQQQQHFPYMTGLMSSPNRGPRLSPRNRSPLHIYHGRGSPQQEAQSPMRFNRSPSSSIAGTSPQRPPLTPKRGSPNERSLLLSAREQDNLGHLELSPILTSVSQYRAGGMEANIDDEAMLLGLSPISKQAADSAISLLQSAAWKAYTNTTKNQQTLSYRNPFADDTEFPQDTDATHDNIANSNSSNESGIKNILSCSIVEYDTTRPLDGSDGISPLHSSSEGKKNESGESNRTEASLFEKSDLKKSSVSSISANTSSEHHVTTKQTNSSSMSHSSSARQQKSSPLSAAQRSTASVPFWGATDPRRYRTVVPSRVFLSEPRDFPNEDDSFSFPFNHRNILRTDVFAGYDCFSAPAQQQQAVPIISRTEMRRLGERSVMSSPH
jgi:hypothetical protein